MAAEWPIYLDHNATTPAGALYVRAD